MDCRGVKLTVITSKLKLQMPDKKVKKKKELAVTFVGIMAPQWESLLGTCPAVFQSCPRKAPSSLWPDQNQNPWFILFPLALSSTVDCLRTSTD